MKWSNRSETRRRSERRGAMLVFVAVSMVALLGFLAMTLDVGSGNRQRRIAQTAVDAAALAGAAEIYREKAGVVNAAVLEAAVHNEASRNGFTDGAQSTTVVPYWPPVSGPHAGDTRYVEVLITRNTPTIFARIWNFNSLNIGTRAVAGVGSYNTFCLFTLDPTGPSTLNVQNGGEVDVNCGVAVNSNHPTALDLNNSGVLDGGASGIGVVGGWDGNPSKVSPTPVSPITAVPNPLDHVVMPSVGACTTTGLVTITTDTTLSPGVYCGGIRVTNKVATLLPGEYIIRGGGFTVETGGEVTGSELILINSIDPTGFYGFKPFDFGTGCKAKLSAQTSNVPLKGIVLFGDPAGPDDAVNIFACASDDPPELTGSLYFPNQTILFSGSNSGTTVLGAVIAKKVDVKAKLTINMDPSGNSGLQRFALVE